MSTDASPQRTLTAVASPVSAVTRLIRWWPASFAASTLFVVAGHSVIKAGLNAVPSGYTSPLISRIAHLLTQPLVLEGLLIYFFGTICWMVAVGQKEISFLYPLTSVNYVIVAGTSVVFFHEVISVRRALGVLVIVLGMLLMNRKSSGMDHK